MRLPIPPPRPSKRPLIAQGVMSSGRRCRVRCPHNSKAAKLLQRKTLSNKCKVLTRKKQVKKLPANAQTPTFPGGRSRSLQKPVRSTEATGGFEPPHKGFADLSLTTWVRRRCLHSPKNKTPPPGGIGGGGVIYTRKCRWRAPVQLPTGSLSRFHGTERETGFEPATSTLARLRSTN